MLVVYAGWGLVLVAAGGFVAGGCALGLENMFNEGWVAEAPVVDG